MSNASTLKTPGPGEKQPAEGSRDVVERELDRAQRSSDVSDEIKKAPKRPAKTN